MNSSTIKVAMIGQKGMPAQFGGVETHVQELAVRLANQPQLDVIAYTRPWYTSKLLKRHKGVRLVSLPSVRSKHLDAITHTFVSILHAAFIERADVIHIHAVGPALLTGLARLVRPQAKVVVTFHCIDRQHQKWGSFAKLMLWLGELQAAWFAHSVISVSKTLQSYMYEVYGRQSTYVPNGVPVNPIIHADLITKEFGLKKDGYIVAVARIVRHKGFHHLIKAYNMLDTDKKLVIVGGSAHDEVYERELQELADGNSHIIFTGNQTGQSLQELFSNAYAYVLPSESEGLPISLLEAASYGRALIASDIPANAEVAAGIGYLFKNTNVADLAHKMQYAIDHPDEMLFAGKSAKEHVVKNYDWSEITKETTGVYLESKPSILNTLAKNQGLA